MKIPFVYIVTGHSNSGKTYLENYVKNNLVGYDVNICSSIDPYKRALGDIIDRSKDEEEYRHILSALKHYNGVAVNTLMALDEILARCRFSEEQPIFFIDIREPEYVEHMEKALSALGIPNAVVKVTSCDEKRYDNEADNATLQDYNCDIIFKNNKDKYSEECFLQIVKNVLALFEEIFDKNVVVLD